MILGRFISFDIGVRNMALCVLDKERVGAGVRTRIRHWELFDLLEGTRKKNANKVPARTLREWLWTSLRSRDHVFFSDMISPENHMVVGIEMQMKQKMAILETCIWGYFKDKVSDVQAIHARRKFHLSFMENVSMGSYAHNKKQAIVACEKYLNDNQVHPDICDVFCRQKKKDDLADALLQALYLSENHFLQEDNTDDNVCSSVAQASTNEETVGKGSEQTVGRENDATANADHT